MQWPGCGSGECISLVSAMQRIAAAETVSENH